MEENNMAGFFANTCLLTYQEGGFLCNDKLRVDAPLSPETLEEAAVQCPKLSGLCLDHTDIGDECFPALARMAKLDMLSLLGSKNITGHGLALLAELNEDPKIDGILVQLPLPGHLDTRQVLESIRPDKDVDCFHPLNVGKMTLGREGFRPCTPAGVMELLAAYDIPVRGKRCVVIGRSSLVGQPLSTLLTQADGTVSLCHSKTPDLAAYTREADILVSAVGRTGLVTADMVKPGAAVVDVAMNRRADGKLTGDVDFPAVEPVAGFLTPVPGGVGLGPVIFSVEYGVSEGEVIFRHVQIVLAPALPALLDAVQKVVVWHGAPPNKYGLF